MGAGGANKVRRFSIFSWEITSQLHVTMSLLSNLSMTRFYSFVLKAASVYIFFFWSCHTACRILVSPPGIEPVPLTVKVRRLNHWTTRELPSEELLKAFLKKQFSPYLGYEIMNIRQHFA